MNPLKTLISTNLPIKLCLFVFFAGLFQLCLFGQEPDNATSSANEKIQYGDLIDVDVIGSYEYDWRGLLDAEGYLAGFDTVEDRVFARCKTENEVAEEVAELYSKVLKEPTVKVKIIDRSKRPLVYLDGAVKFAQRFRLNRAANLSEILIRAGGLTDRADGTIVVYRPKSLRCESSDENNTSESFAIKIADLLSGKADADPEIKNGDIINVLSTSPIYVLGGVKYPGQRAFREGLTLSRVIEASGGLTKSAETDKIIIFRKKNNEPITIIADLLKIKANLDDDIDLKPYDVIDIVERGGKVRDKAPFIRNENTSTYKFELAPLRVID